MFKTLVFAVALLTQVAVPAGQGAGLPPMGPTPVEPSSGIRVTGNGFASAPASQATVTLHVSTHNNALTLNAQTMQPIEDALVKAGADRSSVTLPPYLVGQAHTNNAEITALVRHPTQQMLQQGMLIIANAFASMPDIVLNAADVVLQADNCQTLERNAEANAIANARSNAAFLAKQIGGKLGSVMSVEVLAGSPFGSEGGCTFRYSIGPYGPSFQSSPADMLTVKVYSTVRVHYAIKH
jgi:uncharacterized protein YggE